MKDKLITWFAKGDVGESSRSMALVMAGIPLDDNDRSHPWDPADLSRCLLFLEAVSEARQHMDLFRVISEKWNALIDSWAEIETTLLEEVGLHPGDGARAPKTYALMKKVLGREECTFQEPEPMEPERALTKVDLLHMALDGEFSEFDSLRYRYKQTGRVVAVFDDGMGLMVEEVWNGDLAGGECYLDSYPDDAEFIPVANDATN